MSGIAALPAPAQDRNAKTTRTPNTMGSQMPTLRRSRAAQKDRPASSSARIDRKRAAPVELTVIGSIWKKSFAVERRNVVCCPPAGSSAKNTSESSPMTA